MNTKLLKQLTLATALMAAVGAAAANDTANIKVIGRITPGSCELSLGNGGTFDYGQMDISTLNASTANDLGAKETDMSLTCSGAIQVGLHAIDNQAASVNITNGVGNTNQRDYYYGLGMASDGKTGLGAYKLDIEPASIQIDGAAPSKILFRENGGAWQSNGGAVFSTRRNTTVSWSKAADVDAPAAIKDMTGMLRVQTAVQPTDNLPAGQAQDLNGQATLEVVYL